MTVMHAWEGAWEGATTHCQSSAPVSE